MYKNIFFYGIFILASCGETTPPEVWEDAPEASLVVTEKILSPEERALENKIANRTLLQKVVDESDKLVRIPMPYACSDASGGLLTFIKDKDIIKGIRYAASDEGWSELISLYYKATDLAFVAHEKGVWRGEEEENTQTIFYLDDGVVFRCLRKKARGVTDHLERLIAEAEFEIITTDERLLKKVRDYERLFKEEVTTENIASHFCH